MSGVGPYLQRLEMGGGAWFARPRAGTLAHEPHGAEALVNRGNRLRQQRRYGEALASFEQAIALAPDSAEAFISRGNALQELRRFEEAVASYEKAISLRPNYADSLYTRGIALMQLGRLEDALASTGAGPLEVRLTFAERDVELDVTSHSARAASWPTLAMRERVALCDGELEADEGRLRVRLPRVFEKVLV